MENLRVLAPAKMVLVSALTVSLLANCGEDGAGSTQAQIESGTHKTDADQGASVDSGAVPDGASSPATWDLPAVDYTLTPGAPITAPTETWTFVPAAGAKCANGTATGMAVNLTKRSERLLIYLQGGGACWEAAACAAGTATHIADTMGAKAVLAEAQAPNLTLLFDRNDQQNPFRDASFVYIPYCTGDLHAGTAPFTYNWFGPKAVHHVGARNIDAYLSRLAPTFGEADRVWLTGTSAGGYGATLNWWRVQKALPWARVDVVNDSGLMVDPAADGRWTLMRKRWSIELPPGCKGCVQHLSAALVEQAELLTAPRRLAMLGFLQDQTISLYFGLSGPNLENALKALRKQLPAHVGTYYLTGNKHVLLGMPKSKTSAGVGVRDWLKDFASDASNWGPAGP